MICAWVFLLGAVLLAHSAVAQIGGNLYFELVEYDNWSGRLASGSDCETFFGECDPYFKICIDLEKTSGCNVMWEKTRFYNNHRTVTNIGYGPRRVYSPVSQSVRVKIQTFEHDNFVSDDLISRHEGVFKLTTFPNGRGDRNKVPVISLQRTEGHYSVTMKVRVYAVCDQFVYGRYCERQCRPTERFSCDEEGNKRCFRGWRGSNCHLVDECIYQPCAVGAECVYEHENAANYICKCNGGSGPKCYPGYDFCQDKPCKNGAICVSGNSSCLCHAPFYGTWCENMIDLCKITPCDNNGTCLMSPGGRKMCLCTSGYEGELCEIAVTTTLNDSVQVAALSESEAVTRSGSDAVARSGSYPVTVKGSDAVTQSGSHPVTVSGSDAVARSGIHAVAQSGNDAVARSGSDSFAVAGQVGKPKEWIWPAIPLVIILCILVLVLLFIVGRKNALPPPQIVESPDEDPFTIYEMPILPANFMEQECSYGNGDELTPHYYPTATPGNSEFSVLSFKTSVHEDHVYEDCEKTGPFAERINEPIYAVPECTPLTYDDTIHLEQTRPLEEDEGVYLIEDPYGDAPPPPLPLRNVPQRKDMV